MRDFDKIRARTTHPYAWLWEPLEGEASFVLRSMFGGKAVYVEGRCQFICFYLPEAADDFELAAQRLVSLVGRRDGRIGVESSAKQGRRPC